MKNPSDLIVYFAAGLVAIVFLASLFYDIREKFRVYRQTPADCDLERINWGEVGRRMIAERTK